MFVSTIVALPYVALASFVIISMKFNAWIVDFASKRIGRTSTLKEWIPDVVGGTSSSIVAIIFYVWPQLIHQGSSLQGRELNLVVFGTIAVTFFSAILFRRNKGPLVIAILSGLFLFAIPAIFGAAYFEAILEDPEPRVATLYLDGSIRLDGRLLRIASNYVFLIKDGSSIVVPTSRLERLEVTGF